MNEILIIMAGGASSRMKKSLASVNLSESTKEIALKQHKSLIPVGKEGRPLLHYLLKNAVRAGYRQVYLITSPENEGFKDFLKTEGQENEYLGLMVHFAIQKIPHGRKKPLGTADALLQCIEQHPELKQKTFTICNGDNLYSEDALSDLNKERTSPNALISYSSRGLQFSDERISKFAVIDIDSEGFLQGIIEKPDKDRLDAYRDTQGHLRISMNIFSFFGGAIYPYLKNCPLHQERDEKELPEAVRNMVADRPKSMYCYPRSEHIPDLTNADDIALFEA